MLNEIMKDAEEGKIYNLQVSGSTVYGPLEDALNEWRKHILYLMNKGKFEEAAEVYRRIIGQLEKRGMVQEDNERIYLSFNEWIEDILYDFRFKPKKKTASAPANYSKIYREYASMLFKVGRYDESERVLERALLWNPADCNLRFDHASILKVQGKRDAFFAYSCKALKYAFKPEQLGQGYRNIGSYFMEKEKAFEAAMFYAMSLSYDASKAAYRNLSYLQEEYGIDVDDISMEKVKEVAEDYGFPGLVDKDVQGLMFATGKKYYEEGNYLPAIYLFELYFNLTGNEDVKEVLNFMKKAVATEGE